MQDFSTLLSSDDTTTTFQTPHLPHNGHRRTVDDCYRTGKPTNTIAYIASVLGVFNLSDRYAYYWMSDVDSHEKMPVVWMTTAGNVNIDLLEVALFCGHHQALYNQIIGWCVTHRIPCVLHGDTSRRAWRP